VPTLWYNILYTSRSPAADSWKASGAVFFGILVVLKRHAQGGFRARRGSGLTQTHEATVTGQVRLALAGASRG
jgi:hypothetical protein